MKTSKLVVIMMVLLIVSICISIFSIYTIYDNRDQLLESVDRNVKMQLASLHVPTADDIKIDDAKLLLAVAQYCSSREDCSGQQGIQGYPGLNGIQGTQGIQGLQGIVGLAGANGVNGSDGYTPVKGVDYFDGQDGQPGSDGREIEQRCHNNRVEWRYEGDENWSPLYNLSPLQTCTGGA